MSKDSSTPNINEIAVSRLKHYKSYMEGYNKCLEDTFKKIMNDKELREYAQYIASCLYGKNHKWESVEDIVDILDILKKHGWSKSNKWHKPDA